MKAFESYGVGRVVFGRGQFARVAVARDSAAGSVLRRAKRLVITSDPNPHSRAKPMHRRIVGSSMVAVAVDGFRAMNMTAGRSGDQIRRSE